MAADRRPSQEAPGRQGRRPDLTWWAEVGPEIEAEEAAKTQLAAASESQGDQEVEREELRQGLGMSRLERRKPIATPSTKKLIAGSSRAFTTRSISQSVPSTKRHLVMAARSRRGSVPALPREAGDVDRHTQRPCRARCADVTRPQPPLRVDGQRAGRDQRLQAVPTQRLVCGVRSRGENRRHEGDVGIQCTGALEVPCVVS